MSAKPVANAEHGGRFSTWRHAVYAGAILSAAAWLVCPVAAQPPSADLAPNNRLEPRAASEATQPATPNSGVVQAGCSGCGGGMGAPGPILGPCGVGCVPGRTCVPSDGDPDSVVGRLVHGLYDCICCPDPCYEPRWLPIADSAFFVDAPRPQTQMRLRWDAGFDLKHPDRAEYFWARERTNPNQLEPTGDCTKHGSGKGPACIPKSVDYEDLSLYMETASGNFSGFIETPYREVEPNASDISHTLGLTGCCNKSGFGDLTVGTKSLLLDCELVQIGFEFKTFILSGDFTTGLGTGHVSLEPSILFALKLTSQTYVQGQLAYWIPLGGDDLYQGNIFHMHYSLNHLLWCPMHDVRLIGTFEMNEWSILGGNYTNPDFLITAGGKTGPVPVSAVTSMLSIGPGARLFICDKIDIGVGTAFAVTGTHWAEELIRTEFRWRF